MAEDVLREPTPSKKAIDDANAELREARLPELDPFWVRWGQYVEKHRGVNKARPKRGGR